MSEILLNNIHESWSLKVVFFMQIYISHDLSHLRNFHEIDIEGL